MKFKINLKPYPGADYFTVHQHKRLYDPGKNDKAEIYLEQLQQNVRQLFGISEDYKFDILHLNVKKHLHEKENESFQIIVKDDPVSGMETLRDVTQSSDKSSVLDLSYSFPQLVQDYSNYDYLIIDPNASLGIPTDLILLFYRNDSANFIKDFKVNMISDYQQQIYLLHKVISDYTEKGIALLVRESNYKAVVLHQLIENSAYMKPVATKNNRSKTMISAECDPSLLDKIEKMGYEVEVNAKNGKTIMTIANYPTHSKELVEMLSDRISEL